MLSPLEVFYGFAPPLLSFQWLSIFLAESQAFLYLVWLDIQTRRIFDVFLFFFPLLRSFFFVFAPAGGVLRWEVESEGDFPWSPFLCLFDLLTNVGLGRVEVMVVQNDRLE